MKNLLVMRHAKSSWSGDFADHDRPLNGRGERDAPRMATYLKEHGPLVDVLLSSTAARATATAQAVGEALGIEPRYSRDFYLVGYRSYLDLVASLAGDADTVLTVSHNPGAEDIVEGLSGASEFMSTAAVAWLECDISEWSELGRGTAQCRSVWRPKEVL